MILTIKQDVKTCFAEIGEVELVRKLTKQWTLSEVEGMDVQNLDFKFVVLEFWVEKHHNRRLRLQWRSKECFILEEVKEILHNDHTQFIHFC